MRQCDYPEKSTTAHPDHATLAPTRHRSPMLKIGCRPPPPACGHGNLPRAERDTLRSSLQWPGKQLPTPARVNRAPLKVAQAQHLRIDWLREGAWSPSRDRARSSGCWRDAPDAHYLRGLPGRAPGCCGAILRIQIPADIGSSGRRTMTPRPQRVPAHPLKPA
jgi:hypothetical protein